MSISTSCEAGSVHVRKAICQLVAFTETQIFLLPPGLGFLPEFSLNPPRFCKRFSIEHLIKSYFFRTATVYGERLIQEKAKRLGRRC